MVGRCECAYVRTSDGASIQVPMLLFARKNHIFIHRTENQLALST